MHRNRNNDRNNGSWSELKARRHNSFDDSPTESLDKLWNHLDDETQDSHKVKKDRAAMQLADEQNMLKDMADYADKQDKHN